MSSPPNQVINLRHAVWLSMLLTCLTTSALAQNEPDSNNSHPIAPASELRAAKKNAGIADEEFQSRLSLGKSIYASTCADCHGEAAEGVEGVYESPLQGDLPIVELAKYVADTMPEDEADLCTGEDARLVSQYLHHTFYSRAARLKNNPPKIAFSRRTVTQYQNSVADIMKQLKWEGVLDDDRGINAVYYGTRELYKGGPKVEKIEPVIDFDYGENTPYPDQLKDDSQFSVQWYGGLIVKNTGVYEFIVTSPNGFRLSINDQEYTIDNKVNSADQTEFKAQMKLSGGQAYPFKLTMFKFNEKTSGMKIEWIPPGGVREVIPESSLSPGNFSSGLVFETAFPPDDSSVGYARGTAISRQWDAATTNAAIEAMNFVEENLEQMMEETVGKLPRRKKRRRKKKKEKEYERVEEQPPELTEREKDKRNRKRFYDFAEKFVSIALGRQPTTAEHESFIDDQFDAETKPLISLKRTILLTLKSPQFLYLSQSTATPPPPLSEADRQNAIASTLANVMWDSIPDKALRQAAHNNELQDRDATVNWAWEMLDRPRTRQKLSNFFFHWLEMEKTEHASKDQEVYPGFNQKLIQSLRGSIEKSLDDIVWSQRSDYRQLFLFDRLYVNGCISEFYGIDCDAEGDFVQTDFESDRRCGILTHPYLMTGLSYYKNTSPIHRGVFVAKSLLGRSLKAPPSDVDPLDEAFDPTMTTRERVTHQTKDVNCKGCHSVINPLGFSLENFDAVGRFRDKEKDKPIDAKTLYVTPEATEVPFSGAKDLANYLVSSPEAHRNFIEKLFQHFVKQPVHAFGPQTLDELHQRFVASDFHIRELIVNIAIVATEAN